MCEGAATGWGIGGFAKSGDSVDASDATFAEGLSNTGPATGVVSGDRVSAEAFVPKDPTTGELGAGDLSKEGVSPIKGGGDFCISA